ncbi:MAG: hypothetical protein V3R76_00265 [Gammaproteobacteria bacterium]
MAKPKKVKDKAPIEDKAVPGAPKTAAASRDAIPEYDAEGKPLAQGSAPDTDKDSSDSEKPDAGDEIDIQEVVELEAPGDPPEPIDFEDMDDPRLQIAKKHDEKHRNFIENDESEVVTDGPTDIIGAGDDPEMVEVKVFGQVRMVEKSKVDKAGGIQAYQKSQAVQAGMEDNARQRDTLDTRAIALDERERRVADYEASLPTLDANKATPPEDPPSTGDQSIDVLARETMTALYDGEDNAPELLAQLVKAGKVQGKPIDENAIVTRVAGELEKRNRHRQVNTARKVLYDNHPELDRNSDQFDIRLWEAVNGETIVVERQDPGLEPQQVLDEAYRRISEWKGEHKTESMTDKAAVKRQMNRPRASSGRYISPPPPPVKTPSDYIAALRKSRGQEVESN